MAKTGKTPAAKPAAPSKSAAPGRRTPAAPVRETAPKPLRDYLDRPPVDRTADGRLRLIFWAIAGLGLVLLVALSLHSGINADDKFQADYSLKLVNYYGTFGGDKAALNVPDGNMHLYGGFFETVTGFVNKALGYEQTELGYHNVRHAASAILGWVAMLAAALLARQIAGWPAGLITLVIMLVSPRFVGDSLMNPKDVPFAAGYILALYHLAAMLDRLPKPRWTNVAGLALGLGIALGIRAGGLLSFAIVFLFAGLHFLLRNGGFAAFGNGAALKRYAVYTLGAAAAGYVFALLFWPFALQAPLSNPFVALSKFADLEVKIRVLFEGENVMSDATPWYYPLKWIYLTVPLAALAGFAGAVVTLPWLLRRYQPLWIAMALFAAIFPVFYVLYKNSIIHDGWRHLTFAYPPLVAAAGVFWAYLAERFSTRRAVQYAVYGVAGLLLVDAAGFIARNPAYPYVYFNPLAGGVQGAYGQYETDYWGVSVRQGLEWMEQQGIIRADLEQPVVIATNMFYSAKQLTAKYGDKVKIKYLKWERRCDDAWDYALYPTRFLDGSTLQKGYWPPDNAVHVVQANGVPLLAVLKSSEKNCALGIASSKLGDWPGTINFLEKEVAAVPDNELAWGALAEAYFYANELDKAHEAIKKTLEISPDDIKANNLLGMYYMQLGDGAQARSQFESALKRQPSNPGAWYYLAVISNSQNDAQTALTNLQKAIQLAPNFKPAYELSAKIYEANGQPDLAQRYRAAMSQIK
jgi:Tfp pilus assembly protein PilF